ncbi:MAG: glycosyltransferase [Lentisphaeria bacterium]|nr:glycosyltransferase [Lentisphaeria bacterium]
MRSSQEEQVPPKILYLDCAPFFGGGQRSFLALLDSARAQGLEPFLLAPSGMLSEEARAQGIGVDSIRPGHWGKSVPGLAKWLFLRWVNGRCIQGAVSRWNPDILHANGLRAALLLPRGIESRVPVVLHDRDVHAPVRVRRMLSRRVSKVIAVSKCVAARWEDILPPERVTVVPNGVSVRVPESAESADDCFRATLVADFVVWKRHGLFVDALVQARREAPELVGLVVGRVHDRAGHRLLERLRRQACDLGLSEEVLRIVVDASDALPHIARSSVLVSTSDQEPFGRTVVEALALGKPVVAVRGGGPDDILSDCDAGVLTDAGAESLAEAILRWRTPEARAAVAPAARVRAGQFTPECMARDVAALYDGILACSQGAR